MCPRPQPQNRWSLERWRTPQSQGSKTFVPRPTLARKATRRRTHRNGQLISAALCEVDDALGELVDQALGELVDEDLGELIGDASAD